MTATCETHGHIFGHAGVCVFCGVPGPAEVPEPDLVEALKDVTIHLIAAVSLLQKLHADLAPSKKHALFNTKVGDYNRSIERGRAAIAKATGAA